MTVKINQWKEISERYNGTVLLGNGSSIAVNSSFKYPSLKQHAIEEGLLTEDVQSIFDYFETDDFELILRIVWQTTNVNKSLKIEDDKTRKAYLHVRDCLIKSVRNIHPEYHAVSSQLPKIYDFLKNFNTVLSLNYDLLLYWTMMYGIDKRDGHAFKDCIINSSFDDDWKRFRGSWGQSNRETTLVFYPHGSLILARNLVERELKITSRGTDLLESILSSWESEKYVPLFVSEGMTEQKVASIHNSHYLNTVYKEVLPSVSTSLVVFGWGFGPHDRHILERLAKSSVQIIAVSVFGNDQSYCNAVEQQVRDTFGQQVELEFFDCQSPGCWNQANKEEK
ncbi:DUF4917 family protein [Endozoicomonas sp. ALB115]|uniref:DUF4917 family protein n=1 Tax=Endozoicomonas sp. ALB115 TaxID=3403074 RepID=UPI003BB6044D